MVGASSPAVGRERLGECSLGTEKPEGVSQASAPGREQSTEVLGEGQASGDGVRKTGRTPSL